MARAFWKGSLSFGLVEIPVALRPALQSKDLSFTLLHRKDFAPVGYKRYDKATGREVPWDEIVRGYEYEPDEYVVLTDEELRRANPKATQTIEIVEFVESEDIDPLFFDTPYYVEPQKKGSKSYALLRDALDKSGRVGIARVVLRTRQHLAALMVRGKALVLNLLRYPHELRSVADLDVPKGAAVSPREAQMAKQLIDGMTGKWDPSRFKDEYRDDVMALVRKKIKSNQTHTILEPDEEGASPAPRREVVDLMPLLKASLEKRGGSPRTPRSRGARATGQPGARAPGARPAPRRPSSSGSGRRPAARASRSPRSTGSARGKRQPKSA
jgi:DNA end-binding protein Ku